MSKLSNFLDNKLQPLAVKIGANRYLAAIKDGLIVMMPVMIVGSFALIITEFPVAAYQNFMAGVFGENWKWFGDIASGSAMGISALIAVFSIAYNLGQSFHRSPLISAMLSVVCYFILLIRHDGAILMSDLGARGLFVAIITAVLSSVIYNKIIEKDITIKMPDSVPPAISKSFEALIPGFVDMLVFLIIRFLCSLTPWESAHGLIFNILQMPLTNLSDSFLGIVLSICASHILWFFGIHGASVVGAIMGPFFNAASLENLEAYMAGEPLPHIVTQQFWDVFQGWGGVGATLPLCFLMAFACKSKQIKTLGKLSFVPGIFGVNEPIVYGLPLVLNTTMLIPFFLCPLMCVSVSYWAMKLGIVAKTTGVTIPWTTPPIIGGFLATNDWRAAVLHAILLVLCGVIYYPFIKSMDRKLLAEEQESEPKTGEENA